MSQQINLLNPALIRPRDWLTLKNVALIYAVVLAAMYGLYSQAQSELDEVTTERQSAQSALEAAQAELSTVKGRALQAKNSTDDELALKNLIETRDMQSKMLNTLRLIQNDADQHIVDYMRGFAAQAIKGVWLTGFKLNNFEQQLSIIGQSLSPELVPEYVERLGRHPVFHGKYFSGLVLKELPLSGESKPAMSQLANANAGQGVTDKSSGKAAEAQSPLPMSVVSFEFKGEKHSAGSDQAAMHATVSAEGSGGVKK